MADIKVWTETEMQETYGDLLNAKVRAVRDILGRPQLGKKRQVAIKDGTSMLCYGLFLNKYDQPVARVKFADGSTKSVNPKHLEVVKALSPKEAKELTAWRPADPVQPARVSLPDRRIKRQSARSGPAD